ncbi:sodium-dependent glucose transporter 1 [Galendromus occidentalis]|uniref:Sodium-dependent glucose transporter 1 n=1 Tax=Galendromus occidentalis TaxID=34638 RepID=A0AAJ7P9N7_9ACAR|nr:sodium-dependent glucose transporter 1 [Galendromus occidentalis]
MVTTRRTKEIYTLLFILGNFALGLVSAIIGPTLLDLAEIYNVEIDEVSHLFTSRSGLSTALYPVCGNLWIAHAVSVANGITLVLFEAGTYVALANLWKDPTFALQLYMLGYGSAVFIIPFISEPFLSESSPLISGKLQPAAASRIYLPYAGVGAFCVVLGVSQGVFSAVAPLPAKEGAKPNAESPAEGTSEPEKGSKAVEISLVMLMMLIILLCTSLEMTFTGMITSFVVESDLHLTKSDGAFLGGVFRAAFFAGRILAVIGYKLSMTFIMMSCLTSTLLSSVIFVLFVLKAPFVVWLANAGLGLGLSALFGTSITWTCQYITLKHWHMAATMV